jgi:hypothetical protein
MLDYSSLQVIETSAEQHAANVSAIHQGNFGGIMTTPITQQLQPRLPNEVSRRAKIHCNIVKVSSKFRTLSLDPRTGIKTKELLLGNIVLELSDGSYVSESQDKFLMRLSVTGEEINSYFSLKTRVVSMVELPPLDSERSSNCYKIAFWTCPRI